MKINSVADLMIMEKKGLIVLTKSKVIFEGKIYRLQRFEIFGGFPYVWLNGDFKISDKDLREKSVTLINYNKTIETWVDPA